MSGAEEQIVRQKLLDALAAEPRAVRAVAVLARLRIGDVADFALANYTDGLPIHTRIDEALRGPITVAPSHGDRMRNRVWQFLAGPHGDARELAHSTGLRLSDIADWLAEIYAGPNDIRVALRAALDRIDATWALAEKTGDVA